MSAPDLDSQALEHAETDLGVQTTSDAEFGVEFPSSPRMRRLPWVLLLLPVLQGFWFVHCYGVNVPWADQWNGMAPLFEKWFAGTLSVGDFWAQHNEHRCFVALLLMFGLGLLTRWNTVAEMYATQVVLTLMLAIFIGMFLRDCKTRYRLWLMLPIGFLVFSLRQIENMVWGWQLAFVLVAGEAVAALACLSLLNHPAGRRLKYLGALLFATGATFSSAQGLVVWPVGLLPLLLAPFQWTRKALLIAGWTAAGALAWLLYFHDYVRPYQQPPLAFSFKYFAAILGGSFFHGIYAGMIVGVIVLLLIAAVVILLYQKGHWRRHSFWLAVLSYGFLIQLQITLGRSNYGLEQALSPRYSTCSLLIIIGIYAILSNLRGKKLGRVIFGLWAFFLALATVGLMVCDVRGYQWGLNAWQNVDYHAFMAYTSDSQPDAVFTLNADVNSPLVRRIISLLREHRWSLFASSEPEALYAPPKADLPELSVPAQIKLTNFGPDEQFKGIVYIAGWAVDSAAKDLVGGVFLDVDGVLYPTYYGWPRDDAFDLLHNRRLRYCGFIRFFPDTFFSVGHHRAMIKVLTKDRKAFFKPSESVSFDIVE
jgi:hypothetical protein